MNPIRSFARLAACLGATLTLGACVNIAKLENLPSSASEIRFDEVAGRATRDGGFWTMQTDSEYFLEVKGASFDGLHASIEGAVKEAGYEVVRSEPGQAIVLGQRGLRLNEWSSVVGVYYRRKSPVVQVYIKNEITQDITGGLRINRAKEVGELLCKRLPGCSTPA